jgi:hypothetical protein
VDYLDFVVDGKSLRDMLEPGDLVGCLGWLRPEAEEGFIGSLLLKQPSDLGSGRVMLYICPECGDISCGAITARVEKTGEHFVWRDFGYENDYDESLPDLAEYKRIGPFRFNKTEYWQVLNRRLITVRA